MKTLYLLLTLLISQLAISQSFSLKGKIVDGNDRKPLESATVFVNRVKDSSLITYSITDKNGFFELEGKKSGKELEFLVSFVGYKTYKKRISLDKLILNMGVIPMEVQTEELKGVSVVSERAPIIVKKDTLEFNADSFKTKADASVEDLLKQLPGFEVDMNGKIKVNGKPVNEVLVNGKPFFSKDPKIATKNLAKEIVKKIQVTDTRSKDDKFTGKKSDGQNQSINIQLKEGKDKGSFGRLTAGYGTDERRELSGIINYFKGKERFTALGSHNNINSPGFSYDEIFEAMPGARSISMNGNGSFSINGKNFGGNGQGLMTSSNLGANYVNEIGKAQFNGDYLFGNSNNENHSKESKEVFLPNRHFFTERRSNNEGDSRSHSISGNFEYELDSTLRINVRPNISYQQGINHYDSDEYSLNENKVKINGSTTQRNSETTLKNYENEVALIRRIGKKGGFLRLGLNNDISESKGNTSLYNQRNIYGSSSSTNIRNQQSISRNLNEEYEFWVSYRYPLLSKKLFLNAKYQAMLQKEEDKNQTYDADASGNYNLFNTALSSDFHIKESRHTPTLGLSYNGSKLNFNITGGLIFTELFNKDDLRNTSFSKKFQDLKLSIYANYRSKQGKSFYINYGTYSQTPSVQQLQLIENVQNPLHTFIGNPNLNREYRHFINTNYNAFNFKEQTGLFLYSTISLINNKITPITVTDENLIRKTTYTNVNGDISGFLQGTFRKTITKNKNKFHFSLGFITAYNRNYSYSNTELLEKKSIGLGPKIGIGYNYTDFMQNELKYSIQVSKSEYNLDLFEDQTYNIQRLQFVNTFYLPWNLVLGNDIRYHYNSKISDGYDKDYIFWNMSLGMKLFEDKATLRIKAYDLLNQNTSSRRTVHEDYIQDSENTVLKRYFMLSFTYKWNSLKNKKSSKLPMITL